MDFRRLISEQLVVAPLVFDPLSAKLAEAAGFKALYLGGGGLGYVKCVTEANLTPFDMTAAALDIRVVTRLPLIMDAAGGWGDPMHMVRTIGMAEAAGFAAIEIEDTSLPKRAHHHVGVDHPIPAELMVSKIREAVTARRDPNLVIIARTNLVRVSLDEALRRAEAYRAAGADMLWVQTLLPEQHRIIGERLGAPLMHTTDPKGISGMGISKEELYALGFRLLVDPSSPLLAMHKALRQSYAAIAANAIDPVFGNDGYDETKKLMESIDIERLLAIERRTVDV